MIGFLIWSIVVSVFVIIGIFCLNSKNAVGFFTGTEPSKIEAENVKRYNLAVSFLWFVLQFYLRLLDSHFICWTKLSSSNFLIPGSMILAYLRIVDCYEK